MHLLRRVLTVLALCCAAAATVLPAALAHSGGSRGDGSGVSRAQQICNEVGVPLGGQSIYGRLSHAGGKTLSGAQVQALQAACKKLASAFGVERGAEEAATKTLQQAIEAANARLKSACPRRHRRHRHYHHAGGPAGPIYRIPGCKEARKAYEAAVRAAEEAFQHAREEATQGLEAALEEFDATVQSVLPSSSGTGGDNRGSRNKGH
jgi:hypothetical protein